MASVEQQFLQFWSNNAARVALWADSSYGPLEEKDILPMAKELNFPLVHFTCSFGGGLTVKGDFHDPAGKPEDIVIIEMGYNDESNMSADNAIQKMRKQQWYKVLSQSASMVKFVIFIHQPTYRQVCPPKKKNCFNAGWKSGEALEGSKYTAQAMQLCQELRIPALCLKGHSAQDLFAHMLIEKDGEVWQNEAVSRCAARCTKKSPDYNAAGELAHWEDSQHPTAIGAQLHFRCLVKLFQARCAGGGFSDAAQLSNGSAQAPQAAPLAPQAPQAAWAKDEAPAPQSWQRQAWTSQPSPAEQKLKQQQSSSWQQQAWTSQPASQQQTWTEAENQLWESCQQQLQAWMSQSPQAWGSGDSWNWQQTSWPGNGKGRSQPY